MKLSELRKGLEEDWLRCNRAGDHNRCSVLAAFRMTLDRADSLGFTDFEEFVNMARNAGNEEHVKVLNNFLKLFQEGTKI